MGAALTLFLELIIQLFFYCLSISQVSKSRFARTCLRFPRPKAPTAFDSTFPGKRRSTTIPLTIVTTDPASTTGMPVCLSITSWSAQLSVSLYIL